MPSSQGTDKRPSPSPGSAAQRGPTHSFASLLTPAPFAAPRKRCCLQARTFAEHLTRHSVVEGRQIQSIKEREREITAFLLLGSLMESVW